MVAKINRGASLYGGSHLQPTESGRSHRPYHCGSPHDCRPHRKSGQCYAADTMGFRQLPCRQQEHGETHTAHSLNPSVDDRLTNGQFAELAREYMQKMGYGDQPYIVYLHEDIDRRHIHIVSTCVKENGEKISDTYEWNRSMKACRELERKFGLKQVEDKRKELLEPYLKKADYQSGDVKKQVSNIVKSVFGTYRYQSFGEYSALLSCFNIEAKQVKGEFGEVPYNGIVYTMTDDRENRYAHPSSLPLSVNATVTKGWKTYRLQRPRV